MGVFYFLLLKILRQQKKYCSSLSLLSLCAIPLSDSILFFAAGNSEAAKKIL
jgi:hypothetical protein